MNQHSLEPAARTPGVPEGFVTMEQAAGALGASLPELIRMLVEAGIPIRRLHLNGQDLSAISAKNLQSLLPERRAPKPLGTATCGAAPALSVESAGIAPALANSAPSANTASLPHAAPPMSTAPASPMHHTPTSAATPVEPALPAQGEPSATSGRGPAPRPMGSAANGLDSGHAEVRSFGERLRATLSALNEVAAGVPQAAQAEVRWAAIQRQFKGVKERVTCVERSVVERQARIRELEREHAQLARALEQARLQESSAREELEREVREVEVLERQAADNKELLQRLSLHLGYVGD